MRYFLLFFLASCQTSHTHECKPTEKIRFVDIQTYKDWGTTKLVPIGRRPLPTQKELCSNPLWSNSKRCRR